MECCLGRLLEAFPSFAAATAASDLRLQLPLLRLSGQQLSESLVCFPRSLQNHMPTFIHLNRETRKVRQDVPMLVTPATTETAVGYRESELSISFHHVDLGMRYRKKNGMIDIAWTA